MLNEQLPYFYQLYLTEFPTNDELQNIKNELKNSDSISGVEIFESEHTKLYSLLVLTKDIVTFLFIIVLASSFLMLLQQIRIWFFEYSEKISILQLLGASLVYSTKSIVSIILVSILDIFSYCIYIDVCYNRELSHLYLNQSYYRLCQMYKICLLNQFKL